MESLLNQTLPDIEVIMINDGSPDNCPTMCDEYAKQDARVKVIHKKNEGLGFARNSGLTNATGEFVAFVDSDDYVEISMYEKLYQEAKSSQSDAVFCNFNRIYKNGRIEEIKQIAEKRLYKTADEIFALILSMIGTPPTCKNDRIVSMAVWHAIYNNQIITQNGLSFPSERIVISEDIVFQIAFLSLANRVKYIPDCSYYHYENSISLSNSYTKDRYERSKILHNELISLLSKSYPDKLSMILLSVDRLFLGYVRTILFHTAYTRQEVSDILKDYYLQKIIARYPCLRLPLQYMIPALCMKYKQAGIMKFLKILKNLKTITSTPVI